MSVFLGYSVGCVSLLLILWGHSEREIFCITLYGYIDIVVWEVDDESDDRMVN